MTSIPNTLTPDILSKYFGSVGSATASAFHGEKRTFFGKGQIVYIRLYLNLQVNPRYVNY
jgi:hypothetical protein